MMESPVLLFLGAGASVPLGKPVMKDFVAKLETEITSENDAALLSVLISAREYDLEAIMTDLETFLSLKYVSTFVFDGIEATLDADKLRSLIRHSIIREYRTVDLTRALEVYQPLLDTIFSHIDPAVHPLPIFTTNYDLAIEKFCQQQIGYHLVDGLDVDQPREGCWNPREFEKFQFVDMSMWNLSNFSSPDRTRRHIVLFKLHGSVNWIREMSTGRIVQSLPMYDLVDSDAYQNTIIYPTSNKGANLEPYLTGYHYFSKCCEKAKLIIAIGYSFHDYDTLAGLLKGWHVNEDLRLVLLAPDAYDVLEAIHAEFGSTKPIYGYFGDAQSEPKYLSELDGFLRRYLEK